MIFRNRMLAVFTALLLCLAPTTAAADPGDATIEDVMGALDIEVGPADYVILVDTSQSMRLGENPYASVTSALGSMLQVLQPTDHLSLVTFDTEAEVRYRGPVGEDPAAVLANLPESPEGAGTDIGAGIELGLAELERPEANPAGAIALLTDGVIDTEDEAYATPEAAGWAPLKARADALTAQREVAAYALGLGENTDAGIITTVFTGAEQIPADQIAGHLGNLRQELIDFQAGERLRTDLDQGAVTATWSGIDWNDVEPGTRTGSLVLTSSYTKIPVDVTEIRANSSGELEVEVDGLPESVALQPGETINIPAQVTVPDAPDQATELTLSASVTSAWAPLVAERFGLDLTPRWETTPVMAETPPAPVVEEAPAPAPEPAPVPEPEPEPQGLSPWVVVGALAAAALAALALLVWGLARLLSPRLDGSLAFTRDGQVIREILLTGSKVRFTDVDGLSGTVRATRVKDGPHEVKLAAKDASNKERTRLADGQSLRVGDIAITYTAQHSRMLSLLEVPASGERRSAAT